MSRAKRYLFIRLLEACNADCFMCGYALSRDRYRFGVSEFDQILPAALRAGVGFVRFTGGEPLLHREIIELVTMGSSMGLSMSVITNGAILPQRIEHLAKAGLSQVIVSIDGASAHTHNQYRNTAKLFERGIAGLEAARGLNVRTRVNTVVGPYNFEEMPALQTLLTGLCVEQWELSAIKLERPIVYPDPSRVRAICDPIYEASPAEKLIPMGKRFYGDSSEEQRLYFEQGITPRPSGPQCLLVGDVIYLDPKARRAFGCSLLPHRDALESFAGVERRAADAWDFDTPELNAHIAHFRAAGPKFCTGCSTVAARYSDEAAKVGEMPDWRF